MSTPLRILISDAQRAVSHGSISTALGERPHCFVSPADRVDADIAFLSRDVTGPSTKHQLTPATSLFYEAMLGAPSLRWVQLHSAGADRPVFGELAKRGVVITTASGVNASVVAQSAVAGLLALARRFPRLYTAQRAHVWAPHSAGEMPRDLDGQTAAIVGWGPIGQRVAHILHATGLCFSVVRSSNEAVPLATRTVSFERLDELLPQADWLVLACPLTDRTRGLVGAAALAALPPRAHLINVGRGELVDEPALVDALCAGRLAGAYLDVFAHEPLAADSRLWDLPEVIVTPHCAGFSDGNSARVQALFLTNLARWLRAEIA